VPTYQYACTECGEQLEAVQSFSDPALTECPACSGRLRKVFSSVGVVFKGAGFYRNDSRAGAATGDKSNGDRSKDASGTEPATKSEPAPASSDSSSSSSSSSTPASTSSAPKAAAATP
jgi:putative FmdB family regulatory protein